ncbi:MAG TPA: hypothetical protein ENL09_00135, partial [Bacteroidetes bacterium]|nr:hypothetical protein [Bacteroidota bacterium]
MALPVNIEELLNGKTVEWERIEFRKGWNPERTIRTICAFANDFNNWGGGYIVIGIAEKNGRPVFPPEGLKLSQIDYIQQELNRICRKISPNYFPIVEPVDFYSKKILILWCPGGSNRPYKAPDSLGQNVRYFYYIKKFSSTVQPTQEEERELLSMAKQIPFDDQVNHHSKISDFDLTHIRTYLNDIKSDLENELPNLSLEEISRRMNIAEGGDEFLLPKNVGILFFAKNPQRFFPNANIEIIIFKDESGTEYTEKILTGPIHQQLRNALNYINDSLITEKIIKQKDKPEALRFFNYPYQAIEEALANAVYHRGYDNDSSIEVRIYPDRINIISFPGPLPPLDKIKLQNLQIDVRKYRNRRIGEFLKELHLTEGRTTGIPTIIREMEKNGSPKPVFETDDRRLYFKTSFKIHPDFKESEIKDFAIGEIRTKPGRIVNQDKINILNTLKDAVPNLVRFERDKPDYVKDYAARYINSKVLKQIMKVLEVCILPNNRAAV